MPTKEVTEGVTPADNDFHNSGNVNKFNTLDNKLKFSYHARIRQEQRSITDSSVSTVIQSGQQIDCKDATIYTDQNIKVVFSKDNSTVVTVNKNTRNTRFQLSDRTEQKAKSLLYRVNEHKDNHAMCELAELYLKGDLGEKDVSKGHDLYERAAKMGSCHAMCRLSELYESGHLGVPNLELANLWMKKAADRNNTFAVSIIGQKLLAEYLKKYPKDSKVFRPSRPKKRMEEEILYYLNKGASKGATRAIWQIGNIHEMGLFGEKNLSKAIDLYVKAAKTGSPASLASLHSLTLDAMFSAKELEEILDSLLFMSDTSIGMAFQLGEAQLCGTLGCNPVRGFKMVEQVALKEFDEAVLAVAGYYRDGTICDANLRLAQYWYNKLIDLYDNSAKAGNLSSLRKLATFYLLGIPGEIDLEKAESYFKESIEKSSNPDWILNLGMHYVNGRLGDKPIDIGIELIAQAIKIWQLQTASGKMNACYHLGCVYFSIRDEKNAVYWLSKAPSTKANFGTANVDAQLLLAKIYLSNLSHEKNIPLGLKILENVILEFGISPSSAFDSVDLTITDQTLLWLQDTADKVTKPETGSVNLCSVLSNENSYQYIFQKFVITILAKVYEKGQLNGSVDYNLASKYYYQLFIIFKSIKAQRKLVSFYINQHLPTEYCETVVSWLSRIPSLLKNLIETNETSEIDWSDFSYYVRLLGKILQTGDLLPQNNLEATKWLYLASYFHCSDNTDEAKRTEQDLANLPPLDCNQRVQIVSELSEITKNIKTTSLTTFKVMSRILGDIFYDNKIVDQNINESIYWYTESTTLNNSLAAFSLGKIYHYDKQEISTAIKWYMLSAQLGGKKALNALTKITEKKEDASLMSFLDKFKHRSVIDKSEWVKIKPLKNLEVYPKTAQEKFEVGESCLKTGNKHDILDAAYWFRTAKNSGSIKAAIELYFLYKSRALGDNLVFCTESLYLDILEMCYHILKEYAEAVLQSESLSEIVLCLKIVSPVLKFSDMTTANTLHLKIETLYQPPPKNKEKNKQEKIKEKVQDIISDFEAIILELHSKSTLPHAVAGCLLALEF